MRTVLVAIVLPAPCLAPLLRDHVGDIVHCLQPFDISWFFVKSCVADWRVQFDNRVVCVECTANGFTIDNVLFDDALSNEPSTSEPPGENVVVVDLPNNDSFTSWERLAFTIADCCRKKEHAVSISFRSVDANGCQPSPECMASLQSQLDPTPNNSTRSSSSSSSKHPFHVAVQVVGCQQSTRPNSRMRGPHVVECVRGRRAYRGCPNRSIYYEELCRLTTSPNLNLLLHAETTTTKSMTTRWFLQKAASQFARVYHSLSGGSSSISAPDMMEDAFHSDYANRAFADAYLQDCHADDDDAVLVVAVVLRTVQQFRCIAQTLGYQVHHDAMGHCFNVVGGSHRDDGLRCRAIIEFRCCLDVSYLRACVVAGRQQQNSGGKRTVLCGMIHGVDCLSSSLGLDASSEAPPLSLQSLLATPTTSTSSGGCMSSFEDAVIPCHVLLYNCCASKDDVQVTCNLWPTFQRSPASSSSDDVMRQQFTHPHVRELLQHLRSRKDMDWSPFDVTLLGPLGGVDETSCQVGTPHWAATRRCFECTLQKVGAFIRRRLLWSHEGLQSSNSDASRCPVNVSPQVDVQQGNPSL